MAILQGQRFRGGPGALKPSEDEIEQAKASSPALRRVMVGLAVDGKSSPIRITIRDEGGSETELALPPVILGVLGDALAEMARGNAVRLHAIRDQMTTHEAADLLNVSEPFVAKLIEDGELPAAMIGIHHRIALNDLMNYKRRSDEECRQALDELVALSQELGLGY